MDADNLYPHRDTKEPATDPGTAQRVKLYINNNTVEVDKGTNLLEACRSAGIEVPSLCYLRGVHEAGTCRVCLVEVEQGGRRSLQASCVYPAIEGIRVYTDTPRARRARRRVVELLLSEHDLQCTTCVRNLNCELQRLSDQMGIRKIRAAGERKQYPLANKNPYIVRDYNKCIKCRRCESICRDVQGISVYSARNRGFDTVIAPAFMKDLGEVDCVSCGQCVLNCPTGSLTEREYIDEVWHALEDPDKFVVVQTAPAIQVSLGDDSGFDEGQPVGKRLPAALRRLGFDRVFSTEIAADITIVEEAHELLERLGGHGKLPLISSCSPGWVKFCEHFYPEYVENLSTCKSPMEMLGALIKTYYAEMEKLDPQRLVVVAVMPCTAKKFEAARPELVTRGARDVDFVLTTRELLRMVRQAGLKFNELSEEDYDLPLGLASGASAIFAATGGVMEAAIRTAVSLTGASPPEDRVEFTEMRGQRGIREAHIKVKDRLLRLAVAHGTRNARRLMERLKRGEKFDFIEIMGCPGGCVGGGGQPITGADAKKPSDPRTVAENRAGALYKIDLSRKVRRSHENPAVKKIYRDFLGAPLGEKAREILHTHYVPRGKNAKKYLH